MPPFYQSHIFAMAQFKVLGDEGTDVEVLGETRKAGDVIEVAEEQAEAAAAAVAEGKLEAVGSGEQTGSGEAA